MSKVDAQRAMREANYARNKASGPTRREAAAAAAKTAESPAAATPVATPARAGAAAPEAGERCGHKSMNGRECTREAAHPEKSHRYN